MTKLLWDQTGERVYETGVSHGVLFLTNDQGEYDRGFAWNGLSAVTESPSGAEATPVYADNIKYLNLVSAEEFSATIEAYTYPSEFEVCDGSAELAPGISIGQQRRELFGLSYETLLGNDTKGTDFGRKIHLIYGGLAAPSERAYATVNDSPEAITFSWEMSTTAVTVGGTFKPTSQLTIDSTKVSPENLQTLEEILYGTASIDPRLPLPAEILELINDATVVVRPVTPAYVPATKVITIPNTPGVVYKIDGVTKPAGPLAPITQDTMVVAYPAAGYKFAPVVDKDWLFSIA